MSPTAGRDYPRSYAQLRGWFDEDGKCLDYLDWLRWPDGFVCPRCGSRDVVQGRANGVRDLEASLETTAVMLAAAESLGTGTVMPVQHRSGRQTSGLAGSHLG